MCPPSRPPPPAEINTYWSDEQVIRFLHEYILGSRLPSNVLDLNPYHYQPSYLPEGLWYLTHSYEKKESEYGFWKANGEPCKIFSSSMITGWRTTLEYFEGLAPHGQRTDWLMQEYGVTQTEFCDKYEPKESSRLLCRVFLCKGHSSNSEMNSIKPKTDVAAKINLVVSIDPMNNITSSQESRIGALANREHAVGAPPLLDDDKPNSSLENFSEQECFLEGDYLELNDLDPESHSSSSQNSSCPSKLSDEYFDLEAFLCDPEEEGNEHIGEQQSNSKHNFVTPARPNNIVLQPPSTGSVSNIVGGPRTNSTTHESTIPSTNHGNAMLRGESSRPFTNHGDAMLRVESSRPSTGHGDAMSRGESSRPSTSHGDDMSGGEKKSRMKRLKMYFCFALF